MKTNIPVPQELKRLVSYILKRQGDLETMQSNANSCWNYTWYGYRLTIGPLFCCYGLIGYDIDYRGYQIQVDNDLDKINIL